MKYISFTNDFTPIFFFNGFSFIHVDTLKYVGTPCSIYHNVLVVVVVVMLKTKQGYSIFVRRAQLHCDIIRIWYIILCGRKLFFLYIFPPYDVKMNLIENTHTYVVNHTA